MDTPQVPNSQERKLILEKLRRRTTSSRSEGTGPEVAGALSPAQRSMWLAWKLDPESSAFHCIFALRIIGPLQVPALESALNSLLQRHENLRAYFQLLHGNPCQLHHPWTQTSLEVSDLSSGDLHRGETHETRVAKALKPLRAPFQLETGPLWRCLLLRREKDNHTFHVAVHHIVFDAWSRQIFIRELAEFYNQAVQGVSKPAALNASPLQGRIWNHKQNQHLSTDSHQAGLEYWKKTLAGPLPILDLPFEDPLKTGQKEMASHEDLLLSKDLISRVESVGTQAESTVFMVLLAILKILLHRFTGQPDLVIGVPVAGRTQPASETLIGCLINTLPVRNPINPSISFRDHLIETRATLLAALDHSHVDFGSIVEALAPPRIPHRHPILQVLLNYRSEPKATTSWHDLEVHQEDVTWSRTSLDLSFDLDPVPEGLRLRCLFDGTRFSKDDIQLLLRGYSALLDHGLKDPEAKVGDLNVIGLEDRNALFTSSNLMTGKAASPLPSLFDRLELHAQVQGEHPAVQMQAGSLSYRELFVRTRKLVDWLHQKRIQPGDVVAIALEHSPSYVMATIAVLRCGATFVPLDPSYPAERLRYMLGDSHASRLISTRDGMAEWMGQVECLLMDEYECECENEWGAGTGPETANDRSAWVAEDLSRPAYVIYTSGSTGKPNGVVVAQEALLRHLDASRSFYQLEPRDRVLCFAALSFDASIEQILGTIAAGATVVLRPRELLAPHDFSRFLAQNAVTVADVPPALWLPLTQIWARPQLSADARSLRLVIVGGEEMPLSGMELWMKSALQTIRLVNAYGPTETVITATVCDVTQTWSSGRKWKRVPIGMFLGERHGYILDPRGLLLPRGVPGELFIGGNLLAQGYHRNSQLSEARFAHDPFTSQPGGRMYRTGDICRWRKDGHLDFLGRLDEQVKLRGFRIELGEIEAALLQCDGVSQAAVIIVGRPEENPRIVAALVAKSGFEIHPKSLIHKLQSQLPPYMVPTETLILETLPIHPNGKIDKTTLATWADSKIENRASIPIINDTPLEGAELGMAHLWQELLGRENISRTDNFFDLGGDSLLAMRLMVRIAEDFGVEAPLSALFESHNLSEFTSQIQAIRPHSAASISEGNDADATGDHHPSRNHTRRQSSISGKGVSLDRAPLSYNQEPLYVLSLLQPESTLYQITDAWKIQGPLDVATLETALRIVVNRHAPLRSAWKKTGAGVEQVVLPQDQFILQRQDAEGVSTDEREAHAKQVLRQEQSTPFDLAQGPLFRARLVRMTADLHFFIMTTHHAATDGWSEPLMLSEIAEAYAATLEGSEPQLKPLSYSYLEHAAHQRTISIEQHQADLQYWKRLLFDAPTISHPPLDFPRSKRTTFQGSQICVPIPKTVAAQIQTLARVHSLSTFMVCAAAVRLWLMRYTGRADVTLGSASSGRLEPETHGLIGFFVNMLALRMRIPWSASPVQLLKDTKKTILEGFEHSQIPFELLLADLQPERVPGATPLFQVVVLHRLAGNSDLRLPGLRTEWIDKPVRNSKFDLTFVFVEDNDGITLKLEYSTELFRLETAERMARHALRLMEQLVSEEPSTLAEISPFTPDERTEILERWNATRTDYPSSQCIHQIFSAQANRTPEAIAVLSNLGSWTYRQLEDASTHLGLQLRHSGVSHGTRVGVYMDRSWELIVTLIAVLKAGGAYIPLSTDAPEAWRLEIVQHAHIEIIVSQPHLHQTWTQDGLRILDVTELLNRPWQDQRDELNFARDALDLAYVMYTSGSTGVPKGVMIPHRGVVRLVRNTQYADFSERQTFLLFAPISFDASTLEIWGPLLNGGKLVLAPPGRSTLDDLASTLKAHTVTSLWLTSGLFNIVADERPEILSDLEQLLIGGDVLSVPHVKRVHGMLRHGRIINGYGPTENTTFSCCHIIESADLQGETIPIGRPISNSLAYVLDPHLKPVPMGVEGELYVGGDGLALGYLDQPALTAERFIPNPFIPDPTARLYRTGDQARYRPDGTLEFLGRNDHQVKIRGFRIELSSIESQLLRCAGVKQGAVIALGTGSDQKRLVAYCTPQRGVVLDARNLREELGRRLPDYMIPSAFVICEALPLNANGKVDRRSLADLAPSPESTHDHGEEPRNDSERKMAMLWAEVLGLSHVGIHQDFFALGGHSLIAVRLFERIHQEFGCKLPLAALFEHPTIANLVPLLGAQEKRDTWWSLIVPIRPAGSKTPFFCIHGGGGEVLFARDLVKHLDPETPFFGIQARGLHNTKERHDSIEEMAAAYLEEIRKVHRAGPIVLGGYCMGGLVAYEMALQLRQGPIQVETLILIDSVNAAEMGRRHKVSPQRVWLHKLAFQWGNLRSLNPQDRIQYFRQRFGSALSRRTLWAWRSLKRLLTGSTDQTKSSPGDSVLNETHSAQIIRRYQPKPSDLPTILFRPQHDLPGREDFHLGWKPILKEHLEVVSIPVYPGGMLVEPFIGMLGRELRARLGATQARLKSRSG